MGHIKDILFVSWVLPSAIQPAFAAIEWTRGMRLNAFVTKATVCPDKISDAQANSSYLPVFSTNKEIIAGGAQSASSGALFYITNGFHSDGGWDSTTRTSLMNAEPLATGGGCWNMATEDGSTVGVAKCDNSNNQTFYIEAWSSPTPSGPFNIANHQLNKLLIPAQPGQALGSKGNVYEDRFCFYDAASGAVSSSSKTYIPIEQASNLTGAEMPKNLTSDVDLPGCVTDIDYTPHTIDCVVAKAANSLPEGCDSNPQQRKCILHLLPAFCGDLQIIPGSATADAAIEACLRGVSQGPCVSNPGGAACLSNLFPGITFKTNSSSGASAATKRYARKHAKDLDTRQSQDPIFGDPGESLIPAEDQFWIGFAKSMINSFIGILNHFDDEYKEFRQSFCLGMTDVSGLFSQDLSKRIADGCKQLWKIQEQGIPTLEYQGVIEKAGGITADVISILAPIADAAEAAKALGAGDYIKGLIGGFSSEARTGGSVLEAVGEDKASTVTIFKKPLKGEAKPFTKPEEERAVLKDIEENGFKHCEQLSGPVSKRARTLEIACPPFPDNYSESDSSDSAWESEPEPPSPKFVSKAAPGLTEEDNTLFETLKTTWNHVQTSREPYMPEFANPTLQGFRERIETTPAGNDRKTIVRDFARQFGLTNSEVGAIKAWHDLYQIKTSYLESAFTKITPGFKGLVRRTTALDEETQNMLLNFESGIISQGEPGIYEIRDLVTNYASTDLGSGEPPRKMFAASAGISDKTWFGGDKMFIVESEFGTYTSPAVYDAEEIYEVDFLDGISGKMKLLGYEGVSEDGLIITVPRVFYFKNVS